MAPNNVSQHVFLALVISLACFQSAISADLDIIFDFLASPNVTGQFFIFTGMSTALREDQPPSNFTVSKASMAEFPALNGQSVSYAVLQYPAGSVNPPHTHPRAAELLFLLYGVLDVGFVDTTNKLYGYKY